MGNLLCVHPRSEETPKAGQATPKKKKRNVRHWIRKKVLRRRSGVAAPPSTSDENGEDSSTDHEGQWAEAIPHTEISLSALPCSMPFTEREVTSQAQSSSLLLRSPRHVVRSSPSLDRIFKAALALSRVSTLAVLAYEDVVTRSRSVLVVSIRPDVPRNSKSLTSVLGFAARSRVGCVTIRGVTTIETPVAESKSELTVSCPNTSTIVASSTQSLFLPLNTSNRRGLTWEQSANSMTSLPRIPSFLIQTSQPESATTLSLSPEIPDCLAPSITKMPRLTCMALTWRPGTSLTSLPDIPCSLLVPSASHKVQGSMQPPPSPESAPSTLSGSPQEVPSFPSSPLIPDTCPSTSEILLNPPLSALHLLPVHTECSYTQNSNLVDTSSSKHVAGRSGASLVSKAIDVSFSQASSDLMQFVTEVQPPDTDNSPKAPTCQHSHSAIHTTLYSMTSNYSMPPKDCNAHRLRLPVTVVMATCGPICSYTQAPIKPCAVSSQTNSSNVTNSLHQPIQRTCVFLENHTAKTPERFHFESKLENYSNLVSETRKNHIASKTNMYCDSQKDIFGTTPVQKPVVKSDGSRGNETYELSFEEKRYIFKQYKEVSVDDLHEKMYECELTVGDKHKHKAEEVKEIKLESSLSDCNHKDIEQHVIKSYVTTEPVKCTSKEAEVECESGRGTQSVQSTSIQRTPSVSVIENESAWSNATDNIKETKRHNSTKNTREILENDEKTLVCQCTVNREISKTMRTENTSFESAEMSKKKQKMQKDDDMPKSMILLKAPGPWLNSDYGTEQLENIMHISTETPKKAEESSERQSNILGPVVTNNGQKPTEQRKGYLDTSAIKRERASVDTHTGHSNTNRINEKCLGENTNQTRFSQQRESTKGITYSDSLKAFEPTNTRTGQTNDQHINSFDMLVNSVGHIPHPPPSPKTVQQSSPRRQFKPSKCQKDVGQESDVCPASISNQQISHKETCHSQIVHTRREVQSKQTHKNDSPCNQEQQIAYNYASVPSNTDTAQRVDRCMLRPTAQTPISTLDVLNSRTFISSVTGRRQMAPPKLSALGLRPSEFAQNPSHAFPAMPGSSNSTLPQLRRDSFSQTTFKEQSSDDDDGDDDDGDDDRVRKAVSASEKGNVFESTEERGKNLNKKQSLLTSDPKKLLTFRQNIPSQSTRAIVNDTGGIHDRSTAFPPIQDNSMHNGSIAMTPRQIRSVRHTSGTDQDKMVIASQSPDPSQSCLSINQMQTMCSLMERMSNENQTRLNRQDTIIPSNHDSPRVSQGVPGRTSEPESAEQLKINVPTSTITPKQNAVPRVKGSQLNRNMPASTRINPNENTESRVKGTRLDRNVPASTTITPRENTASSPKGTQLNSIIPTRTTLTQRENTASRVKGTQSNKNMPVSRTITPIENTASRVKGTQLNGNMPAKTTITSRENTASRVKGTQLSRNVITSSTITPRENTASRVKNTQGTPLNRNMPASTTIKPKEDTAPFESVNGSHKPDNTQKANNVTDKNKFEGHAPKEKEIIRYIANRMSDFVIKPKTPRYYAFTRQRRPFTRSESKVSEFKIPKLPAASSSEPLELKEPEPHINNIPKVARVDASKKRNWTQVEGKGPKAQQPWNTKRPLFDVTFSKVGPGLLKTKGSIQQIEDEGVIPFCRTLEHLKLEYCKFPGKRVPEKLRDQYKVPEWAKPKPPKEKKETEDTDSDSEATVSTDADSLDDILAEDAFHEDPPQS